MSDFSFCNSVTVAPFLSRFMLCCAIEVLTEVTSSLLCVQHSLVHPLVEEKGPSTVPLLSPMPSIIISLVEQKKVRIHFISFYIIYMYVFPALVAKRQNVIWVAGIKSNSIIHYYKILLELLAVLYIRYVRWSCRGTPI